jgi:hypothetical protein
MRVCVCVFMYHACKHAPAGLCDDSGEAAPARAAVHDSEFSHHVTTYLCTQACIHTLTRTRKHAYTHTHTHASMHTYTHTHTCTHQGQINRDICAEIIIKKFRMSATVRALAANLEKEDDAVRKTSARVLAAIIP